MATLLVLVVGPVFGQDATSASRNDALRVFLDCRSRYCDFDYLRREIPFVNYVRDRQDAQVHVLVTTRRTGAGGSEFTIVYLGRGAFSSLRDSLIHFSSDTDTFDEVRTGLTHKLKLGLVRYVARLPAAESLQVRYETDAAIVPAVPEEDPWNFWIMRIRVGGGINGEERQSSFSGNASVAANRTTEEWKISLSVYGWYSEDHFEFSDGTDVTSISRNYGGEVFLGNSLTSHWSLGGVAEARTSTFSNHDLAIEAGPGIEYNIFPYSESTRRALTFLYLVQVRAFDYDKTTVFDKDRELRVGHGLEIDYSADQPWGSIHIGLDGSHFLEDIAQHRIDLDGRLSLRLVRGLDLNLRGSIARTKDQIFLPRAGATDEEVLLRRLELGTDYRYWSSISLSYTFGSIYNNVVNPRFD